MRKTKVADTRTIEMTIIADRIENLIVYSRLCFEDNAMWWCLVLFLRWFEWWWFKTVEFKYEWFWRASGTTFDELVLSKSAFTWDKMFIFMSSEMCVEFRPVPLIKVFFILGTLIQVILSKANRKSFLHEHKYPPTVLLQSWVQLCIFGYAHSSRSWHFLWSDCNWNPLLQEQKKASRRVPTKLRAIMI